MKSDSLVKKVIVINSNYIHGKSGKQGRVIDISQLPGGVQTIIGHGEGCGSGVLYSPRYPQSQYMATGMYNEQSTSSTEPSRTEGLIINNSMDDWDLPPITESHRIKEPVRMKQKKNARRIRPTVNHRSGIGDSDSIPESPNFSTTIKGVDTSAPDHLRFLEDLVGEEGDECSSFVRYKSNRALMNYLSSINSSKMMDDDPASGDKSHKPKKKQKNDRILLDPNDTFHYPYVSQQIIYEREVVAANILERSERNQERGKYDGRVAIKDLLPISRRVLGETRTIPHRHKQCHPNFLRITCVKFSDSDSDGDAYSRNSDYSCYSDYDGREDMKELRDIQKLYVSQASCGSRRKSTAKSARSMASSMQNKSTKSGTGTKKADKSHNLFHRAQTKFRFAPVRLSSGLSLLSSVD